MKLVGTFYSAGDVSGVTIVDNIAFIADRTNGLETINVSDPAHPTFVGVYPGMDARDVAVANDIAFVAIGDQGLKIIDVSNPVQPILMGSYDTPGSARGVTVVGDTAFVADLDSLQLINISDPASPTLLSSIGYDNGLLGAIYNVTVQGNTAFLATSSSGIQLLDITDLSSPISLSNYDTPGFTNAITIQDNTAFVADDSGGFQLIDISDLSNPQLLGTYGANGGYPQASAILGDTAFVAAGNGGLQVLDISDSASPAFFDSFDFYDGTNHFAHDVAINGDYAYVADGTGGLKIVTTAKASILEITATDAHKNEGAGDNTEFIFTVSRTGDTASSCTVGYQVGNISSGVDFFHDTQSPLGGLLNFAENETSKMITIKVVGDTLVEPDQTFAVVLSNPYHATLGVTTAIGTILNDDADTNIPTIGNDTLLGTAGNDTISGLTGDDNISGLEGDDIISGDSGTDTMIGGTGNDTVDGGADWDIAVFAETLANASITYSSNSNTFTITTASGGVDTVSNVETFTLDDQSVSAYSIVPTSSLDAEFYLAKYADLRNAFGTDKIAAVTHFIQLGYAEGRTVSNIGNDTLNGSVLADSLNAGAGNDTVSGLAGNDTLTGGLDKDNLNGGAGADKLLGDSGNDTLIGGLDKDNLTGDTGADRFKFNSVAETGIKSTSRDTISDFKHSQGDKIDLSAIDANTVMAGNNAFTSPSVGGAFSGSFANRGDLYFDKVNHILYGNNDTDTAADFSIFLLGVTAINATDFVL